MHLWSKNFSFRFILEPNTSFNPNKVRLIYLFFLFAFNMNAKWFVNLAVSAS